ncbi:MAG TPA: 2OG-Fe(II) oxygenase [Bryobacteraceae bacterium]|nr:2OG-Fe(II) oxygenase [Bryobacteraceae bacterium]
MELGRQFETAQPFKHVVIDNFLELAFCQELVSQFPSFDASRAVNEHGEVGGKAVFPDLPRLGGAYERFDQLMRDPQFLELMSRLTSIPKLLYDPAYVGGGAHENLSGQELDPHVDFNYHPSRHWHRRLNLIVFLNPQWDAGWGGCLELIRDPWNLDNGDDGRRVIPIANRAVIFETTENSWHGFEQIQLPPMAPVASRRSIAVYFYTQDRPAAETAPEHSTVYVQRPLSSRIQPGYTLSEQDVEEIRTLVGRRNKQIKFLYERELEFSGLIGSLLRSPSFRLGHLLTWPFRTARDLIRPGSNGRAGN